MLKMFMCFFGPLITGGNSTRKIHPKEKSSYEQVFLNNFRLVPDSCHREEGKSSRELFEKVRVNAVFWVFFGSWVGFWASKGRYRPKGVFGKGVGNSKNTSEMRQHGSCFVQECAN